MFTLSRGFILAVAMGALCLSAYAGEVSRDQIKSLDEQVQDIKNETLDVGVQMRLLEEKLLYPTSTQVAIFVSLDKDAKVDITSIEIQLDSKPAARHVYTARELDALKNGGVQRIYVGNIISGEHALSVVVNGKTSGSTFLNSSKSFRFSKDVGARMLEIRLSDPGSRAITLTVW